MADILDLFGDPVPANFGGRGRPEHIPTQENRNKVTMLLALGWSNKRIACAIGVTQPTLRKHYFAVLKFRAEQRDRLDASYAMMLWNQVREGNVGAMRLWDAFKERNDQMAGYASFYGEQRRDAQNQPKLGKKEEAARAAETAGRDTEWGDDLKPRMN